MKIIKTHKQPEPSVDELSKMNLEELRAVLEAKEDSRPKYMFRPVEEATDTRDYRYVFWLDLMGAKNVMKLSLPRAARSVMKIHAAALLAKSNHHELEINPVMDGVYGFVKERKLMENCSREM